MSLTEERTFMPRDRSGVRAGVGKICWGWWGTWGTAATRSRARRGLLETSSARSIFCRVWWLSLTLGVTCGIWTARIIGHQYTPVAAELRRRRSDAYGTDLFPWPPRWRPCNHRLYLHPRRICRRKPTYPGMVILADLEYPHSTIGF